MKAIMDLPLEAIDELFRAATLAAKEEADKRALPTVGIEPNGNLLVHPGRQPIYKQGRNVA